MPTSLNERSTLILSRSLLDDFQFNDRHLSSKNEELILKSLTSLIKDITNGVPIFRSVILSIVRYVLPMKSKPVQRVLHVFLEMLPKRDPTNGQFLTDLIMICEIISQQIRGPNEFLAGNALRFVSNITEEKLITPLIPSIVSVLAHDHYYVRMNALNCLLQLSKFIPNLYNDEVEKKIYDVLDNDENVECQVMAFKFIASQDSNKAFNFVFAIAPYSQSLHRHLKYTILRFIDNQFMQQKSSDELTSLMNQKSILLLIDSLLGDTSCNESVLETAMLVLNYEYDKELMKHAFSAIIGVMLRESQTQIKINILELLDEYKVSKTFRQILADEACKILENFMVADFECKKAVLKFISDLIDSQNSKSIIQRLVMYLEKQDVSKVFGSEILQSLSSDSYISTAAIALETLLRCCKLFPYHSADILLNNLSKLSNLLSNEYFANILIGALNILFSHDDLCEKGLPILIKITENLSEMPLSPLFWFYSACINSLDNANIFFEYLFQMNQTKISDLMSFMDDLLPLFVFLTKLMVIYEEASKKRTACIILKSLAQIYSCATLPDNSVSKISEIPNMSNTVTIMNIFWPTIMKKDFDYLKQIISQSIPAKFNHSHSNPNRLTAATSKYSNITFKSLTDPLNLSLFTDSLSRPFSSQNQSFMENTSPSNASLGLDQNVNFNSVVQLTSLNDDLYAEAFLLGGKYEVVLDMLIVNRLNSTVYTLTFGLVCSEGISTDMLPKINDIKPGGIETVKLRIKLSSPTSNFVALSLMYHVGNSASEKQVINMDNVYIASMDHIIPKSCDHNFFISKWPDLIWEKKMESILVNIQSKEVLIKRIETDAKVSYVRDESSEFDLKPDLIGWANFCATTVLGELILISLCIQPEFDDEKSDDSKFLLDFKIRSSDKDSASKLARNIEKILKTFKTVSI